MNTTPEATPVPEWFADDPKPTVCAVCGEPWEPKVYLNEPELCRKCWLKKYPLSPDGPKPATITSPTIRQQLVDALCGDNYDRSDQWHVTVRHIWDTLED